MKTKAPTQAQCDHANALREYERIHAVWMNIPKFTTESVFAQIRLDHARNEYLLAYRIANPGHIAM